MKYILNHHIRYRQEKNYILICDCSKLCDYKLPLNKIYLLDMLKDGTYTDDNEEDKIIINDLMNMNIIS